MYFLRMYENKIYFLFFRKFSQKLPSVSKIIQATMPPEQRAILDRWEANKIAELGKLKSRNSNFLA